MMFQSFASVIVGMECICRCTPDIYCDTMGAAFTYPVAKLIGQCHVVTYTHYPIISSDMLQRVRDQRPAHNNDDVIARSVTISAFKLVYYRLFASAYSLVGSYADKVIVNSSWTAKHISQVWGLDNDSEIIESDRKYNMAKTARKLAAGHDISCDQRQKEGNQKNRKSLVKIFPPCNTTHLQEIPLVGKKSRRRVVLSIGQFRPEKDHMLQLRALKALRDLNDR
jgi:alpha-1,2-mannosyltransferase